MPLKKMEGINILAHHDGARFPCSKEDGPICFHRSIWHSMRSWRSSTWIYQ
jgi:hypothetical protein